MQVSVETVSPVEKKLVVEIPWEDVKQKLNDSFRVLAKDVALKGFRKGKVPLSVVKQMFGKQVRAEVATQLIRESFLQAVQEHSLEPVSEPHVHDAEIKKGEPFAFHAHVEVRPEVKLAPEDYAGLEIERHPIEVSDDQVQSALEQLQRDNIDLQPIEGRDVTARTDVIAISIKGTLGEQEIDRPQLVVDLDDTSREPLPGLAAALTGLPINTADHALELEIPADFNDEALAGQSAKLTISITDARHKAVPELDDEFAKDTGRADSLEALRGVLRSDLEERAADQVKTQLRQAALKALAGKHEVPLAPGLVDRAAEQQMQRLMSMLGMQPGDEASASAFNNEETRERMRAGAADDLRGEFLLEAVAEQEGIEVADEEIDAEVARIAESQGSNPARLRPELERDGKLDNIKFNLRRDKTLDVLVDRATVTDAPPPSEEPEESDEKTDEPAGEES